MAVRQEDESLRELELALLIQKDVSNDHDHSPCSDLLNIEFVKIVLDGLEGHGVVLPLDLLDSCVALSLVAEDALLGVEANHALPVVHHRAVVRVEELAGQILVHYKN